MVRIHKGQITYIRNRNIGFKTNKYCNLFQKFKRKHSNGAETFQIVKQAYNLFYTLSILYCQISQVSVNKDITSQVLTININKRWKNDRFDKKINVV